MRLKRNTNKLDKSNYEKIYSNRLEVEAAWLKDAAVQRRENIEYFLRNNSISPNSIADLGSGTGAVITELQSRNIGTEYLAVDYSKDAIEYLDRNSSGIKTQVADMTSANESINGSFDLVIAIHVLQHLEEPDKFIKNILENINFSYLIIEVPLEDLFVNRFISVLGIHDKNPTGTLQFFNKKSINNLLTKNGLSIVDQKRSTPRTSIKTLKILRERYNWNKLQLVKKIFTSYLLPLCLGPIKRSLHYSYYSVLCIRTE